MTVNEQVVLRLRSKHLKVATAESLTAGMLCAALVDVPNASEVVAGGIIAYRLEQKTAMLGVRQADLDEYGPVHPRVAAAMAEGARQRFGVDIGIGTTGVAGPEPHGGHGPGTVVIAIATQQGTRVFSHNFVGDRAEVRQATVYAALSALADTLGEEN